MTDKTLEKKIEKIAMNIVHQIGDVLMERGLMTVGDRQATNDLFIDFTFGLLKELYEEAKKEVLVSLSNKGEFVTYKKDGGHGIAIPMSRIYDPLSPLLNSEK